MRATSIAPAPDTPAGRPRISSFDIRRFPGIYPAFHSPSDMKIARFAGICFSLAIATLGLAENAPVKAGDSFEAKDTLNCAGETTADAADCLKGLSYECAPFTVKCETAGEGRGDWLVRFPSPRPVGDATNDNVAMEWRLARDKEGNPIKAPAVVVVHESGRGMVAGRLFANGLRGYGIHTFLIHLPGYGARTPAVRPTIHQMLPALQQAVGDVRRASDAVAALPFVDIANTSVLGISLGGFVTATVSGLDAGFDRSFVLLAGGNLPDVILQGGKDAAKIRRELTKAGVTEQQIRDTSRLIEPMRLAHRVNAAQTWLFSGTKDEVVPPACSVAWAKAAKLDKHHVELPVGHYTAAFMIPVIMQQTADIVRGITTAVAEPGDKAGSPAPESGTP
jgi:dienelactone hydrolase